MLNLPRGIVINLGSQEDSGVNMHCRRCWEWSWAWHPHPGDEELQAAAENHLPNCLAGPQDDE